MHAPVQSATEYLTQAVNHQIVPNQEYLLQGSILDSAVEHLLHRWVFFCYFIASNLVIELRNWSAGPVVII